MSAAEKAAKSLWLRFFRDAGIPSGFDIKYALIFDENRIKINMLPDIDKTCLKDMGIKAMGDIIAILKHAKHVYEESKTLAYDLPKPSSTSTTVKLISSSGNGQKTNSSSSSNSPISTIGSGEPRKVIINSSKPAVLKSTIGSKVAVVPPKKLGTDRLVPRAVSSVVSSFVRNMASNIEVNRTPTVVRLKRSVSPPQREEVPVQKKTRVLPEQEGRYIVKMPAGTTEKTQKFLQGRLGPSKEEVQPKKGGIFARLGGEGRVSSSSDIASNSPKLKSSVFDRLGQGKSDSPKPSSPYVERSDFLKTKFEVRQPINNSSIRLNSSPSSLPISDRFDRRLDDRVSLLESRNRPSPGMRSSIEGKDVGVKARLGVRDFDSRRSPSRSLSPIPKRSVASRISSINTAGNSGKPQSLIMRTIKPTIRKTDVSGLSVSRQVVREERFKNAQGKNMIRKIVMKTVSKKRV